MLNINDSKESREKIKNQAVKLREQNKLYEAEDLFNQVLLWDEANNNKAGYLDVLGHLRITYSLLANQIDNMDEKEHYQKLALDISEQAIQFAKENNFDPGKIAIATIHSVSSRLDYSDKLDEKAKVELLKKSLKDINKAIADLPGSLAHKAWPINLKSQILTRLGKNDLAVKCLLEGIEFIYKGYDEEMKNDDDAELKLNVWISGIHLSLANIFMSETKYILAKHYATYVINIEDKNGTLSVRKEQAKKILEKIKTLN